MGIEYLHLWIKHSRLFQTTLYISHLTIKHFTIFLHLNIYNFAFWQMQMTKAFTIHQKTTWSGSKDTRSLWAERLQFESACRSCVKDGPMERRKYYVVNKVVCLS